MQIIGVYKSQISNFYLQQLLTLAQKATAQGEYAGGALLDAATLAKLKEQTTDFSSVPFLAVGERATEASLEHAVNTLAAKYSALAEERNDFVRQMNLYLAVLRQDNQLLEALIRRAELERWSASIPGMAGAEKFLWDFSISQGIVPQDLPSDSVDLLVRKDLVGGVMTAGVTTGHEDQTAEPGSLRWIFSTEGQNEELYGPDWARLSVLEPKPRTEFGAPEVKIVLPRNGVTLEDWLAFFSIEGRNGSTNVPVFIRNLFVPRRVFKPVTFQRGVTEILSPYRVSDDDLVVVDDAQIYFHGPDYSVPASGQVEPHKRLFGRTVRVGYTEYFPAYQCSIDGKTWSTPVMLDPERPNPDDVNDNPIRVVDGLFPLTDETGRPTGMSLRVKTTVASEFTVVAQNSRPDNDNFAFGVPATLEIEFNRPRFLDGIHLEPFVNFPFLLRGIYCEGILGSNPEYVWTGNYLLDRAQDLLFPRREVLRVRMDFFQQNYSIKQHLVDVEHRDKLEAMIAIQSALPYQVRSTPQQLTAEKSGCQYEFGMKDIYGIASAPSADIIQGKQPAFYNGPFRVEGAPSFFRLDAETEGVVSISIVTREYAADQAVQEDVETPVLPGETRVYQPLTSGPSAVEFFVKFQLSAGASVKRYQLQVK